MSSKKLPRTETEITNRIYIYIHIHIIVNEEEGMEFKESKEDRKDLKGGKGRENGVVIISKGENNFKRR